MGRPRKLTPELQKKIVDTLASGNCIDVTCDFVGIGPATFYRWMEHGKQVSEIDAEDVYVAFYEAVQKARATAEVSSVVRIRQAASGELRIRRKVTTRPDGTVITEEVLQPPQWTADAWFLERSFPQRWGKRVYEINENTDLENLSDDELRTIVRGKNRRGDS